MELSQNWEDYLQTLLKQESMINKCLFHSNGLMTKIPPIIMSSILMVDKLINNGSKYNIFVFPEIRESSLFFILARLLFNIENGIIRNEYEPKKFTIGEIISYNGCNVEFLGYEQKNGKTSLFLKTRDLDRIIAPIELLPIFNHSEARQLSSTNKYDSVTKKARENIKLSRQDDIFVSELKKYRYHMDGAICHVGSPMKIRRQINSMKINSIDLKDILFFGQVRYDSQINILSTGPATGIPTLVLANDVYSVRDLDGTQIPIRNLVVEIGKEFEINNQLDALEACMQEEYPITILSQTSDSFNLKLLVNRGFKVWRWDEASITPQLSVSLSSNIKHRIANCTNRKINYVKVNDANLSQVFTILNAYKKDIEQQSRGMIELFYQFFGLSFLLTRNFSVFSDQEISQLQESLECCEKILIQEKNYLSSEVYENYSMIFRCLSDSINDSKYLKYHEILRILAKNNVEKLCIVTPERWDVATSRKFWERESNRLGYTQIKILSPQEFLSSDPNEFCVCIIVSWLNEVLMKSLLYSNNCSNYHVLLFEHENTWRERRTQAWSNILSISDNQVIVRKYLSSENNSISTDSFLSPVQVDYNDDTSNELDSINLLLNRFKYRQYIQSTESKSCEVVLSIPVSFCGNYIAFLKESHELICVTDLIHDESDSIVIKLPKMLEVGDFVVFRESDRDLIKEIADSFLKSQGKSYLRDLSEQWQIGVNKAFREFGIDKLAGKLIANGCTVTKQTINSWANGLRIIPQNESTLVKIAKAINDENLIMNYKDIFAAGKVVQSMHQKAGIRLSQKLKVTLPQVLGTIQNIEVSGIIDPINIDLEEIGKVTILKIADIGEIVEIPSTDINRLIKENKEVS